MQILWKISNRYRHKNWKSITVTVTETSLVDLATAVLVSRPFETDFLRSWSWSWSVGLELFFKTTHVFDAPISYGRLLVFASYSSNKISNIIKPWSTFFRDYLDLDIYSMPLFGGIFMRPHRARMRDSGLCNLVFAKM